ncbi:hypothetical protein ACHAXM_001011 [Skeletonema potamos]|jgi:hypothetical protein
MKKLFKAFAQKKEIDVRDLRVTLGGDTIYPNASPESLGLYDMIEIEAAW